MRKLIAAIAVAAILAGGLPVGPDFANAANAADLGDRRLIATRTSLLGVHRWYQQTYRGVDVLDGIVVEHVLRTGGARKDDGRKAITDSPAINATVTKARALAAAGPDSRAATLVIRPGSPSRLAWAVKTVGRSGATRTLVDALDGSIIEVTRTEMRVDGSGTVFDPNPIVTLQDPTLTDANDADLPVFGPAYRSVTLTHLDGSGYLRGDFAAVTGPGGVNTYAPSLAFDFNRSSSDFSQTMAYYHITRAQEYIQSLGFVDVVNRPQAVFADAIPDDGSFFDGIGIYLGTGGVDDAEDADIIWHEYGHAIQFDQFPSFGGGDTAAIFEGFGDYWAATMSQPVNGGYNVPCIAEWNRAGYPSPAPCLRRVDLDLTVADRTGAVHFDGQIWARALWDINQALGRDAANTIILEAHFAFPLAPTMGDAARVTTETAQLLFGSAAAKVVREAFADRRITQKPIKVPKPPKAPKPIKAPSGLREVARLGAPEPGGSAYLDLFEPYDLNDRSEALFASNVGTGGQAVFVADKRVVDVARSGDPAPGGGIFGIGIVPGAGIDKDGNVAFAHYLDPFELPFGRNAGVYRSGPGGTRAIVVPGETVAPTGGAFLGAGFLVSTNDRGDVAFAGMISTASGISDGVGMGIFLGQSDGSIRPLVVPGDAAPGGSTFDLAVGPSINAIGDVAFTGHIASEPCASGLPQSTLIGCDDDLFFRRASTGEVVRLTSLGGSAPGGGVFLDIANPVLSDNGDIVFAAVVDTGTNVIVGVYVVRDGTMTAIATEGTAMPGGGRFLVAALQPGNADINDRGDIAFSATLDTDDNFDGLFDTGLYRWSAGTLSLVVRSGVALPSGQVIAMQPLATLGEFLPFSGAAINHSRRMLWQATVLDSEGFLQTVLYTSG